MDLATEKLYVYENGTWNDVQFEQTKTAVSKEKGTLELQFHPSATQESILL